MDQSSGKMNKDFLGTVTDLLTAGKGVIGRKKPFNRVCLNKIFKEASFEGSKRRHQRHLV